MSKRFWLFRNYVDGVPQFLAFDNPYPCYPDGDPMTLGEPYGLAFFVESDTGREWSDAQVMDDIRKARPAGDEIAALQARLAECERERDEAIKSADFVCDSYAKENQRLSYERDELRAEVARLTSELEGVRRFAKNEVPRLENELAALREACLKATSALQIANEPGSYEYDVAQKLRDALGR
jgi:chromosome segregation ATPase